jgi:hypothetical protein
MLSFMQSNPDYFEEIYNGDITQKMWNAFYVLLQSVLDTFYPTKSITITESDPKFVTPEIKSLLRKRSRIARTGHVEKANAISSKINSLITKQNSRRLTGLNRNNPITAKEVWDAVRKLTGKNKSSVGLSVKISMQNS